MEAIVLIIILIFAVVIHEVAHGVAADALGDPTARLAGRLTLNPLQHLDWFGSVIVPGLLALSGTGVVFGWAKPVPYNPFNLRGGRWGPMIVAGAGPAANLVLALIFGLVVRWAPLAESALGVLAVVVVTNVVLAIFNLIPVPPLDGSKILSGLLPYRYQPLAETANLWSFGLVLVAVWLLWPLISWFALYLSALLIGPETLISAINNFFQR